MHNAKATRDEAWQRIKRILPHCGRDYARLRNYDLGPGRHRHVSQLSPWIRHRLILEEEVVSAVLARHSFTAAEKFVQEVFWRTYWKGWLQLRPAIWFDYRRDVQALVDRLDREAALRDRWQAATSGRSGIESLDSWVRELLQTGYLHNHARMWFASIWIFTLDLPWQLGADFFLRHLLDGDPASNTLSWRWVAGLQTAGKTYLARPDNIAKYTAGRFGAVTGLAMSAPALSAPPAPPPQDPPQSDDWDRDAPSGLLLTEEDLRPDFLLTTGHNVRTAACLAASTQRSPLAVSPAVSRFVDEAFADTVARLRDRLASQRPILPPSESPDAIVDWAKSAELRQVITCFVPTGPAAEKIEALKPRLAEQGIALRQVLRPWDQLSWPHATHGFFRFRSKIPGILTALGGAPERSVRGTEFSDRKAG